MTAMPGAVPARRLAVLGWIAYGEPDIPVAFGGGRRWYPGTEALNVLRGRRRVSSGPLINWILTDYGNSCEPLAVHRWPGMVQPAAPPVP